MPLRGSFNSTFSKHKSKLFDIPAGETVYTTTGSHTYTVPNGVNRISVLAIGGGGAGAQINSFTKINGGGGGGLGWIGAKRVNPGDQFAVQVGTGGPETTGNIGTGVAGGDSYFKDSATCAGFGGEAGQTSVDSCFGGGFVGDGGGNGGNVTGHINGYASGGGGAGGYSGNGGRGGFDDNPTGSMPTDGSGGGGGGGGAAGAFDYSGSGGGTGINGEGANGTKGTNSTSDVTSLAGGGSGGSGGTFAGGGGLYGGGGHGAHNNGEAGAGGNGVVRIIWGRTSNVQRTFPSTQTDSASSNGNVTFI